MVRGCLVCMGYNSVIGGLSGQGLSGLHGV